MIEDNSNNKLHTTANNQHEKCAIIGITGETGSGKTTFSKYVAKRLNCLHIDGDLIGHQVLKEKRTINSLVLRFGQDILEENQINRAKLGKIVFSNPNALVFLNEITHPRIYTIIETMIAKERRNYDYIVIEGAALTESSLHHLCAKVIYFYAPSEVRLERLVQGRGIDYEKAQIMISAQKATDYYKSHSDRWFDTTKDSAKDEFVAYLYEVYEQLK